LYNAFLALHAKWDQEPIKSLRWFQKDFVDEGVPVPVLGPDMVDWQVVDKLPALEPERGE
jgi:hypothetical protein